MLNQSEQRSFSGVASMGSNAIAEENRRFMIRVYNWMAAGLALTGAVAWIVASDPALTRMIFGNTILLIGLGLVWFVTPMLLSARIMQMSVMAAMSSFMFYSALTGALFSSILLVYSTSTITSAFVVTSATFATMSFVGYTTKKDLTTMGGFLIMGLIGVIIASIANFFIASSALGWALNYITVFIFIGLIAYDTQKIKEMNIIGNEGTEEDTKEAINGALILFLDFVILFINLVQIIGGGRD